jgi:hypothetical protein
MKLLEVVNYTHCKICGTRLGKGGRDHRFGVCDKHVNEGQLDEFNLKHAAAAGALGLATIFPTKDVRAGGIPNTPEYQQQDSVQLNPKWANLANAIAKRYRIDTQFAYDVVELAHKYEKPSFPKAEDILAKIGIESSFNPEAVSKLKKDPARGLTQVRPKASGIPAEELSDIENQIKHGADILHKFYKRLKDKRAALLAYNVGPTAYKQGRFNPEYFEKFQIERNFYPHRKSKKL